MPWPYNGYVYILTPSPESWQNTRRTCQSYGGDLAVVGIKDYKTRLWVCIVTVGLYVLCISLLYNHGNLFHVVCASMRQTGLNYFLEWFH